jgi:uncharacterized protein with FMN-binding domain
MFPRRGAIALITTVLALSLLFSFKTPDEASGSAILSAAGSIAAASPAPTSAATTPPATAGTTQTLTGSLVSTRYGDVEVQVTISGGTITAVNAVALPTGGRSGRISASAAPILASEAVTAQSASIDIVSGATYTSEAYARSLQAALDQAGIVTAMVSG